MSFDLYFYTRKTTPLTEEIFADYLSKNIPFNNSAVAKQWSYENPETGVYFLIDWNEADVETEDLEMFDSFPDFNNLNFSFSINFFRPNYFGFEIFPIIESIIKDLDLYVLDPQDEEDPMNPQKFPIGYLQDQWLRHNSMVTQEHFNEMNFKYMPAEKSDYIWWYQLNKQELENSLEEDIYVPTIFVLESKHDGKLYSAITWPEHIPIILPTVDYIIIRKNYTKYFKKIEESGIVAFDVAIKDLGKCFLHFEFNGSDLKILRQEDADRMTKTFNALKIESDINGFGTLVNLDNFVNSRPVD